MNIPVILHGRVFRLPAFLAAVALFTFVPSAVTAEQEADPDPEPVRAGVQVSIEETDIGGVTDENGSIVLSGVPTGPQIVLLVYSNATRQRATYVWDNGIVVVEDVEVKDGLIDATVIEIYENDDLAMEEEAEEEESPLDMEEDADWALEDDMGSGMEEEESITDNSDAFEVEIEEE